MRPLRHAAVEPFRVEPRQEETDHAVHAAPRRPDRRFVAGREEDGVGPTSGRAAAGGDLEGSVIDLQTQAPRLLGVAPEADARERAAAAQRPGDGDERAHDRPERAGQQLSFVHTPQRDRCVGDGLERLDLTPRHLEEAPRQGCDRRAADTHSHAESEGERELAGGRSGGVAGDDREQAERVDFCDPRQAEGREREGCDDTACAHRIVVRVEPVQGERSEEHTSELQSHSDLVCRLLLEKKKKKNKKNRTKKRKNKQKKKKKEKSVKKSNKNN